MTDLPSELLFFHVRSDETYLLSVAVEIKLVFLQKAKSPVSGVVLGTFTLLSHSQKTDSGYIIIILNSLQVKKLRENWLAQWRRASGGRAWSIDGSSDSKFWGRRCGWNLKFRVSYNHKGKLGEFLICEWISVMNGQYFHLNSRAITFFFFCSLPLCLILHGGILEVVLFFNVFS